MRSADREVAHVHSVPTSTVRHRRLQRQAAHQLGTPAGRVAHNQHREALLRHRRCPVPDRLVAGRPIRVGERRDQLEICLVSALDVRVELGEAHTAQRRRILIRAFDDSNRERVCEPVHPGDRRRVRPLAAAPEQLHVFSVDPIGLKLVDLATPQRFRRPASSHDCASPCHVAAEIVSPRHKKRRVGAVPGLKFSRFEGKSPMGSPAFLG